VRAARRLQRRGVGDGARRAAVGTRLARPPLVARLARGTALATWLLALAPLATPAAAEGASDEAPGAGAPRVAADPGAEHRGAETAVAWRRVADLPRSAGATSLAVDPASGDVAVGDAAGVLRLAPGGRLVRVLRRGPARDLVYLGSGALLAATQQGLHRIEASGRTRQVAPAPGAARLPVRLAAARGVVAVATEDGAFLSGDAERWQRIAGLPSGPVAAVALRAGAGGIEGFALVRGELHAFEVERRADGPAVRAARRVGLGFAFREEPIDVVPGLAGADLALLFPRALALRDAPGAAWRLVQPALPPGALAHRVAEGFGRLWLATDRGLLEAEAPGGPWSAAAEPVGSREVGALVAGPGSLHAAAAGAVLAAEPGRRAPPRGVLAELPEDPPIERVHRAVLDFLDLGPARIEEMRRGVRRRGWLPELALAGATSRDRDEGRAFDQSFVSGALRDLVDRDEGISNESVLSLSFTWDLADLAFHPEQIDISREAREVIELRDDVLDEITQLYFERRRVLVELASAETPADAIRLRLRAAELAAGIDAWTGGWFSRALRGPAP
jgi:hypothetical protein